LVFDRWSPSLEIRGGVRETFQNSLRLRKKRMGDLTLRSDRFLNFIVEMGWANGENVLKDARCQVDASLWLLEE